MVGMARGDQRRQLADGPEITSVRYDEEILRVSWAAGPNPAATYVVGVFEDDLLIAAVEAGKARNGWLPFDPQPDVAYTVAVQQWIGQSPHGWSQHVEILTAGPVIRSVATAADRVVTVGWSPPAGPALTAVQPVIRWNGIEVHLAEVPAAVDPLVVTLPADVPNAATIALRGIAGLATGPLDNDSTLLTVAPAGLTVDVNGGDVLARWDPVSCPAVDRYAVSLLVPGEDPVVVVASGPEARIPYAPATTPETAPAVTVAAMATEIARGVASAQVDVPPVLFVGPSYLAPGPGRNLQPAQIQLLLPQLFVVPPPASIGDLPLGFELTAAGPPYAWLLTIPADSPVWTFTDRVDIPAAWVALVDKLEGLGATPYGIAILTEALSRAMPQTFDETLFLAYGLQFARGCIDLRPGVVLRVAYEGYQVAPGAQATTLSGYVTSAGADYEVVSYDRSGTWTNGLDAFLAALAQGGVVVPEPSSSGGQQPGGGGVLDAFTVNMQAPFVRLVYPPTFLATTSPGSAFPQLNAVLLAGRSISALETATDNVRNSLPPGPSVAKAYFRGRTVVSALVRIVVDGVPRLVPLGTTLGNVLAGAGARPPNTNLPLAGVTLRRPRAAAVIGSWPAGDWVVRLGWAPAEPYILDLPLLHGDRLELGGG